MHDFEASWTTSINRFHTGIATAPACSLGLLSTSQQYFSLRTNQPSATSRNQPAVL
jgi:hypothetical protein